jgi:hypothetical protein
MPAVPLGIRANKAPRAKYSAVGVARGLAGRITTGQVIRTKTTRVKLIMSLESVSLSYFRILFIYLSDSLLHHSTCLYRVA